MADTSNLFARFRRWSAGFRKRVVADEEAPWAVRPAAQHSDPQVFVLKRELSEVHLLLDNLSADPDKDLSSVYRDVPDGLPHDWLEKVCRINWNSTADDRAKDAALLVRVKDFLNRITRPATGRTIAFTLLYTGETPVSEEQSDAAVHVNAPTRRCMALIAYPGLLGEAQKFRKDMRKIQASLIVWLVLTCAMSWYVGFGNAVIAQRNVARTDLDVQEAKVKPNDGQPILYREDDGDYVCLVSTERYDNGQYRKAPYRRASATEIEVCDARNRLAAVDRTLAVWLQPAQLLRSFDVNRLVPRADWWIFGSDGSRNRDPPPAKSPPGADQQIARENASYGSALLRVLGTSVLPIFCGVIGAGIAVVRGISRKTKLSQLAPRDRPLAIQQLALGAAMGACIGLFMAEPSTPADSSPRLASTVALSSAALSFVAGFGVEHVFTALDALIRRVFLFDTSASPSPADRARIDPRANDRA